MLKIESIRTDSGKAKHSHAMQIYNCLNRRREFA